MKTLKDRPKQNLWLCPATLKILHQLYEDEGYSKDEIKRCLKYLFPDVFEENEIYLSAITMATCSVHKSYTAKQYETWDFISKDYFEIKKVLDSLRYN